MVDPNLAIDEKIIHVDENNNVIGSTTRKEMVILYFYMHAQYLYKFDRGSIIIGIDRVAFSLTTTSNILNLNRSHRHQFYIQKRTNTKDYCPGYYDLASGGVMADGES